MADRHAKAVVDRAQAVARHGVNRPRGQRFPAGADAPKSRLRRLFDKKPPPTNRFGRLFDLQPCPLSPEALDDLVALMKRRGVEETSNNIAIPAGITYLAQFVDHDITFDPMSILAQTIDLRATENFRTPRLDLDSVYGSGPRVHPFLYDWDADPPGTKMLIGRNAIGRALAKEDLPRNQQGRALVGDARNDEHVLIAQLHLLFLRFHNAVVDHLHRDARPRTQAERNNLLENAQEIVRWHYQWMVVHEFLCSVAGDKMGKEVLDRVVNDKPPTPHDRKFRLGSHPFIPVEFSGAVYRFGHSMVRAHYRVQQPRSAPLLATFPDLGGFRWLPESLVVDWDRFFSTKGDYALRPEDDVLQFSQPIDTGIAGPLFRLPDTGDALPRLNLQRGADLKLPSGQDVAKAMDEPRLEARDLRLDDCGEGVQAQLLEATPLWYYILSEAAKAPCYGAHLGPVGGRIVAEVLVHLVKWDTRSYLSKRPPWEPELGAKKGDFTMVDLIRIAREGVPA